MSVEAIQKIKEAEDKGAEIIAKAKEEAKNLSKTAEKESALKYEDIIKASKEEAETLIKKGEEEGKKIAEPILKNGISEKEKILNIDSSNTSKAINLIYERIVKSHGNS